MQVCFAFGLEEGLDDVAMLSSVGGAAAVARVGYQDDTYIVGSSSIIAKGFDDLEKSLAKVGHRMRRTKCSAWAPACDRVENDAELPRALRDLLERLSRARGGLKLLGGAVQGALEVHITADDRAAACPEESEEGGPACGPHPRVRPCGPGAADGAPRVASAEQVREPCP